MEPVLFFILFFLGASLGSFLYATALRLISGEGFARERSRCPGCGETLRWFELMPLVSYVLLGGQCKRCGVRFSVEYLIAELFMGCYAALLGSAVFRGSLETPFSPLFSAIRGGEAALYLLYLLLGSFLFLLLIVDFRTQFILMAPVRALLILGFLLLAASGAAYSSLWNSGASMTALLALCIGGGFFLLWAGTKGRGLGYGDVEVSLLLSLFLPYPLALIMILISFWLGAVVGIGLMIKKGYGMKSRIPFGPFLILGFFITLFWGEALMARLLPLP